jgi:NADPH:quinone reductase-like Zn-dependent oxidoreductase
MMKAVIVHKYGGPEELKFEEFPDPVPAAGEVLVRVAATSINPFDIMRRSGAAKDAAPIKFPGVVGVDLSGTILKVGPGVSGFAVGDQVFAMADQTYAELCVVKASSLAKIPAGLDLIEAAALPLVTTTGNQLISVGTGIQSGQTVLVTGAVGNVGRSAVFTAKDRGAVVIAGVLKRQVQEAASLGADQIVATDDEKSMANLPDLDAVADAVGGKTAEKLIAKVKRGGVFASVLGAPQNAKDFPSVKVVPVYASLDPKILLYMAQAVKVGKLKIPIGRKLPLQDAEQGHAAVAKGGAGKLLLVVDKE